MPIRRHVDPSLGLAWYEFAGEPLPSRDRFRHAMVTRTGGVSTGPYASLNLGGTVGDAPDAVAENHRRLCQTLGIEADQIVSPHQVHGNRVACVGQRHGGKVIPATDALITEDPRVALLLRYADCVPVLLFDPAHPAVGLAHAGWRGVASNVVSATISELQRAFGSHPQDLWAGVGPAIGAAAYEVGEEVVRAVRVALPPDAPAAHKADGRWHIDLPGAVLAQLQACGVEKTEASGLFTASHTEEWYSHRAESGKTGRFGVVVMLA